MKFVDSATVVFFWQTRGERLVQESLFADMMAHILEEFTHSKLGDTPPKTNMEPEN